PPPPPPLPPPTPRPESATQRARKQPSADAVARPRRPFACALRGRQVEVRLEGDEERYRRLGLLAAFRSTIGLVLVCRRRLAKAGGKGFRIDDFLVRLQRPLPADKRVEFHGRYLGGMPVSD